MKEWRCLKKSNFKYIEDLIRKHRYIEHIINKRVNELMAPYREDVDQNIGGSSGGFISNTTEKMALIVSEDLQLKHIKAVDGILTKIIDNLPEEHRKIIELRYWSKRKNITWAWVSMHSCYSERACYKIRDKVVMDIYDQMIEKGLIVQF